MKIKKLERVILVKDYGKVTQVLPRYKIEYVDLTPYFQVAFVGFFIGLLIVICTVGKI